MTVCSSWWAWLNAGLHLYEHLKDKRNAAEIEVTRWITDSLGTYDLVTHYGLRNVDLWRWNVGVWQCGDGKAVWRPVFAEVEILPGPQVSGFHTPLKHSQGERAGTQLYFPNHHAVRPSVPVLNTLTLSFSLPLCLHPPLSLSQTHAHMATHKYASKHCAKLWMSFCGMWSKSSQVIHGSMEKHTKLNSYLTKVSAWIA